MNDEMKEMLADLRSRLRHMWKYLDLESKSEELKKLEGMMGDPGFWSDAEEAQKTIEASNNIKEWLVPYRGLDERLKDIEDLIVEVIESGDEEFLLEMESDLHAIEGELGEMEVKRMLSGELDKYNCFITINSGAGGTESCDWVQMLSRMYQRWASTHGWKFTTIDIEAGDVAGIKSITLKIDGQFAYGYSKGERGVHRLVRISPFDSNKRRHTSFASVDITPEIDEDINIEVKPDDIRIDTFRASGAGGQHVNTTDSAVRVTHSSTGIVVTCQNERSQLQNKETCMKMLRSKLYEREVLEREKSLQAIRGDKKENSWGSQIRNYVFQPYTLVKDNRTKVEVGNVQSVMDGGIDPFIYAYLKEFS